MLFFRIWKEVRGENSASLYVLRWKAGSKQSEDEKFSRDIDLILRFEKLLKQNESMGDVVVACSAPSDVPEMVWNHSDGPHKPFRTFALDENERTALWWALCRVDDKEVAHASHPT